MADSDSDNPIKKSLARDNYSRIKIRMQNILDPSGHIAHIDGAGDMPAALGHYRTNDVGNFSDFRFTGVSGNNLVSQYYSPPKSECFIII